MSGLKQRIINIFQHQGFVRYAKNTSWLMGEKILRMAVGLFVGVWVARYLGPEQYGLLSYAQSFVFLFTAFATLGLDSIVVRELVKDDSQRDVLLGTSFVLKLVGSLFILPFLWVAVQFTSNDSYTNVIIFITALATIFQSFNVIDFYYQSTVMGKYVALANTICLMLSSLIKVVLIINNAPLIAFAWMAVFDSVVLAIGLIYFYLIKTKQKLTGWGFDSNIAKQLLKDSYPLIISGVMISLYMRIDQVMIKEMLDTNAVGQFAAAVRISEAWYFIPMALCSSLFPAIANAKKTDSKLYIDRLSRLYATVAWLGLAVGLFVSLFGYCIIYILYGNQYIEAVNVLNIHIWAGLFVGLGVASNIWLNIENLNHLVMRSTFLGVVTNIGLNFLLAKKYGVAGVAFATLVSYSVSAYLSLLLYKQTRSNFYQINKSVFGGFK